MAKVVAVVKKGLWRCGSKTEWQSTAWSQDVPVAQDVKGSVGLYSG